MSQKKKSFLMTRVVIGRENVIKIGRPNKEEKVDPDKAKHLVHNKRHRQPATKCKEN